MANDYNPNISKGPRELGIDILDSSGEVVDHVDYGTNGIRGFDEKIYGYTDASGKRVYTTDELSLPTSISLDEKTGNIKISAPKSILEMPEFRQTFDESFLKEVSQAYKLNPDYKVTIIENEEEKEIAIPEYVEKLNSSLSNFIENHRLANEQRVLYTQKYGAKAQNMSDTYIQMSNQFDKATYIPDIVFNVNFFGDDVSKGNPFKVLQKELGEDGDISVEKLKEVYTRSNLGRAELAGLLATIDGALRGSDWSPEEYYQDEDGNDVYNRNSAKEAAKLIAFRNFILANDPEAEWWQQAGDNIESFGLNAVYGFDRVFMNIGNVAETAITLGQGHNIQSTIKDLDTAMGNWNEEGTLVNDATQVLATLGMLGGSVAGTVASAHLGGVVLNDISAGLNSIAGLSELSTAGSEAALFAMRLGEAKTAADIIANTANISKGAQIAIKMLSGAGKIALVSRMALEGTRAVANANFFTQFLFDTVHDALVYDSTTLRDTLEASDQNTRNYWLGQLSDNAKWWIGMGAARGAIKFAGKTTLGKAADAVITPLVNKIAARVGKSKQAFKDYVAGGSVVSKLEDQLETAIKKGQDRRANRIRRQIEQENWNTLTRDARETLGDIKLDWSGVKLTEDSLAEFNALRSRVKALENGIDSYNRNISYKRQEMVGQQYDPSTSKTAFINPTLGGANVKTTDFYMALSDLGKKYNLPSAEGSLISQDMVDYMVGRYYEGLATSFARGSTENAAKAQNALTIIQGDLAALRERLPEEITSYIDNGINGKVYQSWYMAQNEYGMAKGLLDKNKITGYENNPIWKENGYMPIVVQHEKTGYWVENTGKIDAVIEQDFNSLTFNVKEGQHYADPELVRQSRLSNMAQAEVNKELLKSYTGFGSNATNVQLISGEETEYVRRINDNKKSLEKAVSENVSGAFAENFNVEIVKTRGRKPIKNETIDIKTRSTVVSSMSPYQTTEFLVQKKVLPNSSAKLTDSVTRENYTEWFGKQNDSVKKYLRQQYGESLEPLSATRIKNSKQILKDAGLENDIRQWSTFGLEQHKEIAADKIMADNELHNAALNQMYENYLMTKPTKALSFDEFLDSDIALVRWDNAEAIQPGERLYSDVDKYVAYTFPDGPSVENLRNSYGGTATIERNIVIKPREVVGSFVVDGETEVIVPRTLTNSGFDALKKVIDEGGDDFEAGLQRAYLIGDKNFAKTSVMNEAARNLANGKDAFYQGVIVAKTKGELRNVLKVDVDSFIDDVYESLRGQVDDYVEGVRASAGAKATMDTLAEVSDGAEDVEKYLALRELSKKENLDKMDSVIDKQVSDLAKGKKILGDDERLLQKKARELARSIVRTELNDAASSARTINSDLVDAKTIYDKAKSLDKQIREAEGTMRGQDSDVVMYLDDEGRQVYAQVDPAFASLFNYRFKMDKVEASVLAKVNAATSKLFRYGTTSVNLASFGNQLFRDFGNAILVGGSWQTIKTNANNLKDVFGENIVEQIKRFDPSGYEMKQVEQIAEATGQTIEAAAVSRELMRGAAISPTTTERTLYRDFMKQAYGDDKELMLTNAKNRFQEIVDKYNPEELLNSKRENYLRNRVYASSMNDAMKAGYNLEQSRVYATFAMNNATTNFSRQLYHMQAIADSTPYFRAAINGTKSFWRMWSLDPVGISGRIMGGLILPTMFLTGASLGSEENRKVYESIPEYQKQNNFIFVFNGETISMPIPQELGPIVEPFRQFVEYLHGSNKNDFWELMMNDALGFFPYDLQGFSTIDMDQMISDPTIFDRISRGTARVFSQLAPIPLKTTYMLATGTDPYSGKDLRNTGYSYYNAETGTVETMDYNQNSFAQWFASLFGDSMSANLAEKIVSGVIGQTGTNILGDVVALVQEGPEAAIEETMTNIGGQISKPFTVAKYDLSDAVWNRAVRQLSAEKDSILQSKEMKALLQEMQQTTDPEKRRKIYSQITNITNDFQQRVGDAIKRLGEIYEGTFDRKKFAAVVQLLNFNTDPDFQTSIQATTNEASATYWSGRDAAIRTMADLGVSGTNDLSIFGYLTTDREGNTIVRYSSPVAIMDMQNQWQNQDDINLANIKVLVNSSNLWDAHESVKEQINKIYGNKIKLKNSDYAAIEAIQINWNAQVAKAIAPYLAKMTPEAAVNNTEVMNYLYPLIEVPNSWETSNKGKYVSLGSRGNKKKAYYDSWIKSMFSVNDAYKGQY